MSFKDMGQVHGDVFPTVDLCRCVDALIVTIRCGFVMRRDELSLELGYENPYAEPFENKLQSLKRFGLIGEGDEVVFTALAADLVRVGSSWDEMIAFRREAMGMCPVFEQLLAFIAGGYGTTTASGLRRRVIALGVPRKRASACVSVFIESAKYAKVIDYAGSGVFTRLLPPTS